MAFTGTKHRKLISTPVVLLFVALFVPGANAQDPKPLDQTAPPPAKVISREERSQINQAKDEKARIKLSIELAETHLVRVESQTSQQQYEGAAAEAGMYWALIEDALSFMKTVDRKGNKRRDLYKRLELSLRAHGPRWATVRRTTPAEYAVWIKEIEEFAMNGRTEALNSFYDNTVIRGGSEKSSDAKNKVLDKP